MSPPELDLEPQLADDDQGEPLQYLLDELEPFCGRIPYVDDLVASLLDHCEGLCDIEQVFFDFDRADEALAAWAGHIALAPQEVDDLCQDLDLLYEALEWDDLQGAAQALLVLVNSLYDYFADEDEEGEDEDLEPVTSPP